MHRRFALIATLLLLAIAPAAAQAKTTLDVQIGWGSTIRIGRWTPVVITVADPDGPDVIVEAMCSHDMLYGVKITQYLGTLSTTPKQFQLLVPLTSGTGMQSDPVWVVIRNAKSGKVLAKTDPEDPNRIRNRSQWDTVDAGYHMIGVSGDKTRISDIRSYVPNARLSVDHLDVSLLPITAIGYDMLDVLVLNAPDLNEFSKEQQDAIAGWVKAGGNLLMWPGDSAPPQESELLDLLPCTIGKLGITELSPDALSRLTLPKRFARIPSHALTPARGGERVKLFGDDPIIGYQRNVGLGKVMVSPINLAALQFDEPRKLWAVWSEVLGPMIELPADAMNSPTTYGVNRYGNNPSDTFAKQQIADVLGTVPGAGKFGFSYVAIVLIGMMVIVGPVDWFVLRALKKQAWTWVTTSGWIALVTLGAIYIGHMVKSGDLHLRTFSLIDQADGAVVGRQEMVGIYSPRTADYNVGVQPLGWWQPFAPGMYNYYGYNSRQVSNQVDFHQTYRDNQPAAMQINVWSLRFLEGQTIEKGDALLDASLKFEQRGDATWVVGTVTNRTGQLLRGLQVITNNSQDGLQTIGTAKEGLIIPGASVKVEGLIRPETPQTLAMQNQYQYGYYNNGRVAGPADLWTAARTLGGDRATRIKSILRDRKHVCLLAGVDNPKPAATIDAGPTKEQHWQIIRAVVPVE